MRAEELYGEGGYTYLGNGDFQPHGGHPGAHAGNMPSKLNNLLELGMQEADRVIVAPPPGQQQPYYGSTRG